jgi:alpha-L-fucosidase 2
MKGWGMRMLSCLGISLLMLPASVGESVASPGPEVPKPPGEMLLWYRQPGQRWLEGLPLGNGIMGAMVFGGVTQERIALNEGTFWAGRPHDYDNPEAHKYFGQIRDLVFAEKSRRRRS